MEYNYCFLTQLLQGKDLFGVIVHSPAFSMVKSILSTIYHGVGRKRIGIIKKKNMKKYKDQEIEKSVCKLFDTNNNFQGTGFVIFSNFIITNAHLFENYTQGAYLKFDIEGYAEFSSDCQPNTNSTTYKFIIILLNKEYDFALLEFSLVDHLSNLTTFNLPPGLLKRMSPVPFKK